MLIVHEERLLHRLWRNSDESRPGLMNLRQDEIHGLHLPHTKRTPSPADEADYQASFRQQVRRRNELAVVVRKFERRRRCSDRQDVRSKVSRFQVSDRQGVNRLRLRRNVLGDQFPALGEDLRSGRRASRTLVGFLQRSPLHLVSSLYPCAACKYVDPSGEGPRDWAVPASRESRQFSARPVVLEESSALRESVPPPTGT